MRKGKRPQVKASLDLEDLRGLKQKSEETGISVSSLIRMSVKALLRGEISLAKRKLQK